MDGYNAVMHICKERSEYISILRKCIAAHHKEKEKQHSLGFEWSDVRVWPVKLALLATEYDLLKVTYKSNSATCYMVSDIEGAEKALQDIEVGRIAMSVEEGMALRVWLSATTMKKLREYVKKEFPTQWDAEGIVVERALNLFFSNAICQSGEGMTRGNPRTG